MYIKTSVYDENNYIAEFEYGDRWIHECGSSREEAREKVIKRVQEYIDALQKALDDSKEGKKNV